MKDKEIGKENNKIDENDSNVEAKEEMVKKKVKQMPRKQQKAYFAKVKGHYKVTISGVTYVKPHYRKVKHAPVKKYKTYTVPSGNKITVSSSPTSLVTPARINFDKILSDKYWTKQKKKKK
jgi:hypothetical protein